MALVAGVAAAAAISGGDGASPEATDASPTPTQSPVITFVIPDSPDEVGVPLSKAGCGPVQEPELQPPTVVAPEEKHAPYSSEPPTSGAHYPTAAPAGVYFVPHDPETMVANMAEGDVVVWHTGFSEAMESDLIGLLKFFESEALLAQPGDDRKLEHEVVLTAWGRMQECERFSGEAVAQFFLRYRGRGPGLD